MQINNLTESNVNELQDKLTDLLKENPDIESRVYPMDDSSSKEMSYEEVINQKLIRIEDKVEGLEKLLHQIFDGHILINGEFKKINV